MLISLKRENEENFIYILFCISWYDYVGDISQ